MSNPTPPASNPPHRYLRAIQAVLFLQVLTNFLLIVLVLLPALLRHGFDFFCMAVMGGVGWGLPGLSAVMMLVQRLHRDPRMQPGELTIASLTFGGQIVIYLLGWFVLNRFGTLPLGVLPPLIVFGGSGMALLAIVVVTVYAFYNPAPPPSEYLQTTPTPPAPAPEPEEIETTGGWDEAKPPRDTPPPKSPPG